MLFSVIWLSQVNNSNSRILIVETKTDGTEYLLVNLYNGNTESEQLKTLRTLSDMLNKIDHFRDKNIINAGDFNLFFISKLESHGGNPILKNT